jgi:acyl transferase domain-containing protein
MAGYDEFSAESDLDVAIIGMAGRFPEAETVTEFWQNLCDGVESVTFFSDDELMGEGIDSEILSDPNYVKASPVLEKPELFDAAFFGYSPREAEQMDPQHRLFLEQSWNALEHAGYDPDKYNGSIGVFGGTSMSTYLYFSGLLPRIYNDQIPLLIGNDKDFLTTRVSYKLNLTGPSINIQTACSTSLVAVHVACQSLINNECDIALAGGVSLRVPYKIGYFYNEGGMMSPDGHCRPFDAQAQGTTFGSGVGIVVLKRLADAIFEGDTIYAVIKGSAINNDGAAKAGFTAPSVDKQAEVIEAALAMAQVNADTISYIESHGTGTPLGDPIEIRALTQAYRRQTDRVGYCAIGSVKSNIGHLDVAAGVTGLIKASLALKYKKIPPSLNYQNPNPKINFEQSPFYVNQELQDWKVSGQLRRAGVTSLGVGGTNVHVILEEPPKIESQETFKTWHILPLSAKTQSALDNLTHKVTEYLKDHDNLPIEDVAFTLQQGRKHFNHRRSLVCVDRKDAVEVLSGINKDRILTSTSGKDRQEIVFMFSGQGSQYVNMCRDIYDEEPVFQEQLDLCCEIFQTHLKLDLRDILFPRETAVSKATEKISQTFITQPALFTIEYSLAKLFIHFGVIPSALVGHSIGEYVAACISGIFSLEDTIKLVAARGRLMQSLPPGAMIAVSLSEEKIQPYLSSDISLAVLNSSRISVLSGEIEKINKLKKNLIEEGIDSTIVRTSHAFHSHMMEPILDKFVDAVEQTARSKPFTPIASNVTGTWITPDQAVDPKYWANHIRRTVKFSQCIGQLLSSYPDGVFLEIGPGNVLSNLVRQHPDLNGEHCILSSTRRPVEQSDDVKIFLTTLSQLWLNGNTIKWSNLYAEEKRRRIPLPTYPFERKPYWLKPPCRQSHKTVGTCTTLNSFQDKEINKQGTDLITFNNKETSHIEGTNYGRIRDRLQEIFAEFWGSPPQDMSISISFLEQGFDSLSLTQIASRISKEFNVTITFAQLMESLTNIELLTRYLEPYLAQSAEEIESGGMKDSADISLLSQQTYDGSNEGELAVIIKEIQKLSQQVALLTRHLSDSDHNNLVRSLETSENSLTGVAGNDVSQISEDASPNNLKFSTFDSKNPPVEGAKLGRDPKGNPCWYIKDANREGKYKILKSK